MWWEEVAVLVLGPGDSGGCRDGGWDRFPPPRHPPTPKHPWLECSKSWEGGWGWWEPGPSSSGQRSWGTPLSGKVCPRLGVRGLGTWGPVCHPGLEMVRNTGRSGAPKDREVLSGQDKTP